MKFFLKFQYSAPALLVFLNGCALYNPSSSTVNIVKTCNVPSDQSGTINGHWPITPIPIAFHQGDFDASTEQTPITKAADTWNQFYTASMNITTIDYGGSVASAKTTTTSDPAGATLCNQGILQGTKFGGAVGIYKLGKWPTAYPASAMALTTFCYTQATPYRRIYMAVMELNYQNFFVSGQKIPDLQSIVLHEMGHLMGLDHSCSTVTKAGYPDCANSNIDPDYLSASMYPVFGFDQSGNGEVKQTLGTNDQSRANCLYTGTTTQ